MSETMTFDEMKKVFNSLSELIDKNCKKCFGRGYEGMGRTAPIVCICIGKSLKKRNLASVGDYLKVHNA